MTYEEAIEWLKRIKLKYIHGGDERFDEKRALAIDIAIEALKKQVPMKPRKFESIPHARCPQCNNTVKMYCDAHEYHHCLYCGQRIDWSDEE